jgi:Tfp pilus assembly protein PilF
MSRQVLADHFQSRAEASLAQDPATALEEADRVLRIDPDAIESYYVKAAVLARFDQPNAARRTLEEAARREPGDFVTWALLGDLAVRAGREQEARRLYSHALRLNPRDPTLRQMAEDPLQAN